jgi:hypothetical protein
LPYAAGNKEHCKAKPSDASSAGRASELQVCQDTDRYTVKGLEKLSEDAMETLIVSLSCALSQRRLKKAPETVSAKSKYAKATKGTQMQLAECAEDFLVQKHKYRKSKVLLYAYSAFSLIDEAMVRRTEQM